MVWATLGKAAAKVYGKKVVARMEAAKAAHWAKTVRGVTRKMFTQPRKKKTTRRKK